MKKLFISLIALLFISCGNPDALDNFGKKKYTFVNQDNEEVVFPDDYKGKYVVMGFLYTNCPDVCPLITQNMQKMQKELNNPDDIQFVGVTFDPQRDTPEVLKYYKDAFKLDDNFNFLTGDTTTVNKFMEMVRVRSQVSYSKEAEWGEEIYFLNHSDKIMVINPESELIFEYGGSMTRPGMIVEDILTVYK